MTLERYASLETLADGSPVTTSQVAARLRSSMSSASHTLDRLAAIGLATRIRPGLWHVGDGAPDRFRIISSLTSPAPAYVSFRSALSYRGAIDQIPRQVEIASPSHPRTIATSLGPYVVHRIPPRLFGGWSEDSGRRVATTAKALFDIAYVAAASKRRTSIPELDLADDFDAREVRVWLDRIEGKAVRTLTQRIHEQLLKRAAP